VAIIVDGGSYLIAYKNFTNLAANREDVVGIVNVFKSAIVSLCTILRSTLPNYRLEFEQVDFFHATHDGQPSGIHRLLQVIILYIHCYHCFGQICILLFIIKLVLLSLA
jgi:hypothetical protein